MTFDRLNVLQEYFVGAVTVAADTIFSDMTRDFIQRQRDLIDRVEAKVLAAVKRIAKDVSRSSFHISLRILIRHL